MIEVKRTPNTLSITGHAHYAEPGKDIVCAAVSTLVQTLLWSLEGLTEDVVNNVCLRGNVYFKFGNLSERAQLLMDSFFVGIQLVAENYPDYVTVREGGTENEQI